MDLRAQNEAIERRRRRMVEAQLAANDERKEYQEFVEGGKLRINESLYALVPPWMTMGEFEDLAVELYDKIRDAWESRKEDAP